MLLHFDDLCGKPTNNGAEGPYTRLMHLMDEFSFKHKMFPPRLIRMGLIKRPYPVSGGGSSDIYKAYRGGKIFAVKELREHYLNKGNPGFALRVRSLRVMYPFTHSSSASSVAFPGGHDFVVSSSQAYLTATRSGQELS